MKEELLELSNQSLFFAFILLVISIIPVGIALKSKNEWGSRIGVSMTYLSFSLQLLYFVLRWIAIGHAPVSNLYEFMTFFGIMLIGSALIMYHMYKQIIVLLFAIPVSLIIMGYGAVFTRDASPLIPALQSNWLSIHVITVAVSSAILSIAFVTGIIYLLKVLNVDERTKHTKGLEFVMYCLVVVVGFIISSMVFTMTMDEKIVQFENRERVLEEATYKMPAIVVNDGAVLINDQKAIGGLEVPNAIDAKKLNSILWAFIVGSSIYSLIRLITKKKIIQIVKPLTSKVNPTVMDEMTYRVVIVGFPLFSLGGLLFAMIWAHQAWGRFWGWDPKEVWALITWLFYAAFLHLRTSKGWEGKRTAWMGIIGFGLIVFNQVFVNLVIAGLHSYA
ncbi:c-type cytochrome biogenesis protein CcsB [Sporosarcina saromensis]|uniref:C-type cytochrome biogenesis protein CcsB n=1 Tax=Sporosarcina saromensis TaxID=359365 RepID=A0ABU4GE58_9BACL|nr:c-type cytochrome biogenesis protein CcsB [Sporosarcina saromensis]MDW0115242.1 c-type cytochrome biogenesis protein CcsB [Sporosarcina saromensis]